MTVGSAFSNVVLVFFENLLGRKRFLMLFSLLIAFSGAMLFSNASYPVLLFALLIGNVSTTRTEAGPFQSVEAGIPPNLMPPQKLNRAFGIYNMLGTARRLWARSRPLLRLISKTAFSSFIFFFFSMDLWGCY